MITVLSPAKNLNFTKGLPTAFGSQPLFVRESTKLIHRLRKLSVEELQLMLKISNKLALLNHNRYQNWHPEFTVNNSRPAVLAFSGLVYKALNAYDFTDEDMFFAQAHLRLLSALHGVLRPYDLIQPYRLEMGIDLDIDGKNLYGYWGGKIHDSIQKDIKTFDNQTLINLASKEYMKAVQISRFKRVINISFKQLKGESLKTIVVYTKMARGMMARFIIKNRIVEPDEIKHFDSENYFFNANLSDDNNWIFTR